MKKLVRIILCAILLISVAGAAWAQKSTADPRVKKAFDKLGLKYDINDKGNYLVTFTMESDEERSQLVRIMSGTEKYRGAEIREIWTLAADLEDYPDEEILYRMMAENSTNKLGAWAMEASDDGVNIYYTTKIPVNITAEDLKMFIYFVAEIGDELEVELLGTDDN